MYIFSKIYLLKIYISKNEFRGRLFVSSMGICEEWGGIEMGIEYDRNLLFIYLELL